MTDNNSHFTHRFVNNGQVTDYWQSIFSAFGCIISIICIYSIPPQEINGVIQKPGTVRMLLPILTVFFYGANIGFQSLMLKFSRLPLIKYFGALLAIELMLIVFLFIMVGNYDEIEINRYFKNRYSLLGFLLISLPAVFNNLLSFLIEYLHPQMVKNGSSNSNVLDDDFVAQKKEAEK